MADLFGASTAQDILTGGDGVKSYDWNFLNSANATQADVNTTVAGNYSVTPTANALLSSGNTAMPFLYQNIVGDFDVDIPHYNEGDTMSVRIGLMARDPSASAGEDYVGIWRNHIRGIGEQTQWASCTNDSFSASTSTIANEFTRITRVGNVFTLYAKVLVGDSWTQHAQYTRSDFAATIQLGIVTAYISNGFVSFSKIGAESFNGTYTVGGGTTSTIDATLPLLTSQIQSYSNSGSIAATLPLLTFSGYINNPYVGITATFPILTSSITLIHGNSITINGTFPILTSNITTSPVITIDATFPLLESSIYALTPGTSQISGTFPKLTASISGFTGNVSSINAQFPLLTAEIFGGSNIAGTLPMLTCAISGFTGNVGSINAQFPLLTFNGNGVSSPSITIDATFPMLTMTAQMLVGNIGTISVTFPLMTSSGYIAIGRTSTIAATFPILQGSLIHSQGTVSIINARLPLLTAVMYLHNNEQSYVNSNIINTATGANTVFTNFFFNSFCKFNGRYYGANQYGIFELGGETDNQTEIDVRVRSGKYDFGMSQLKSLPESNIVINSRSFVLKTIIDNDHETEYAFNPDKLIQYSADTSRPIRVKLGKGTRSRYWEIIIENIDGNDLELEGIELPIEIQSRKTYR